MKFKRIDDATINCIITSDDLEERGLTIEDLFRRKEEAGVFLKEIIDLAGEEVDYRPTGAYLTMQLSLLPDQSISLTLSESRETSLVGMLKELAERLKQFAERFGGELSEGQAVTGKRTPGKTVCVYAFPSIHTVARFASVLSGVAGSSALYKDETEGVYYLLFTHEPAEGVVLELSGTEVDPGRKELLRMMNILPGRLKEKYWLNVWNVRNARWKC